MSNLTTFAFVLRWHFVQFAIGLTLVVAGMFGFFTFVPDPPDAIYQTLAGMIGRWPCIGGALAGAFNILRAWTKAHGLANS